jgi:hypothetical protein
MNQSFRGRRAAIASPLALALTVGFAAGAGDLADVTVTEAKDPVNGVRMIEVSGTAAGGKTEKIWLMISDRNYQKLTECEPKGADRVGPALAYSDRSHMVNVVVCDK